MALQLVVNKPKFNNIDVYQLSLNDENGNMIKIEPLPLVGLNACYSDADCLLPGSNGKFPKCLDHINDINEKFYILLKMRRNLRVNPMPLVLILVNIMQYNLGKKFDYSMISMQNEIDLENIYLNSFKN